MRKFRMTLYTALVLSVIAFISCSGKGDKIKINQGLAARVGDAKITMAEFERKFDELSEAQKLEFKGEYGKAKFLDQLIDKELIYQEALRRKLDQDEEVRRKIEDARRQILAGEFYRKEIVHKLRIPEKDIKDYYENHKDEFMTKTLMRAQHIFTTDSMKAVEWKKRLAAGEDFSKIAKFESEDKITALTSGSLGYFNPGGYIKSVGISQSFSDAVEKLNVGEISDIIHWEKGYSIVRVNEKRPGMLKPLSEVRKEIEKKLRARRAAKAYQDELERLRKKYKPENYIREKILKTTRTPEELWELAQLEDDPNKRIEFYLKLASLYPDHRYAPEALFMVGFIYAEELRDLVQARRVFDRLIERYPDSDVVESAKWMKSNMNKPHPKFETFEQMKESMDKENK